MSLPHMNWSFIKKKLNIKSCKLAWGDEGTSDGWDVASDKV